MNGADMADTINNIAKVNNQNTEKLEESIRSSALLQFRLNLFSCLMSVIGFATQFSVHKHEKKKNDFCQSIQNCTVALEIQNAENTAIKQL